ncbi:MAG TPA: 16S rRNA (cytosine(967)-C(5))-methyltransferase RsmB [Blastocatellia bacterium]|nr:16S rRNA (cytosine(967)-C(5))-methyltransferase RsmB [Blastocatellia bacterium]
MSDELKRRRHSKGSAGRAERINRAGGRAAIADRPQVSPSRRSAFEILKRVNEEGAYASVLLASMPEGALSPEDRRLVYELTLGVLRRQSTLDYFIARYSKRPVDKIDLPVLIALRLGVYQLRFLSRIPPSAAVNESVSLVKQSRTRSAAGLVNAVLRKASTNIDEEPGASVSDPTDRLSIECSHPRWMIERWIAQFGVKEAEELARANISAAPLAFRVNVLRGGEASIVKAIDDLPGISRSSIAAGAYLLDGSVPEILTRPAEEGLIYFQDEASQLVSLVLDPQPGESILDLCASPGSKTSHIAALSNDRSTIVACDVHRHRVATLASTCRRLGVRSVLALACDATLALPFSEETVFDRALVDAPCSGTGTLRQNPEIKWRLQPEDIQRLAGTQSLLLEQAARVLRRGGTLVYSTCSIEAEEDESVVADFLNRHGEFESVSPDVPSSLLTPEGFVRTLPHRHGCDGFFVAVMRKC